MLRFRRSENRPASLFLEGQLLPLSRCWHCVVYDPVPVLWTLNREDQQKQLRELAARGQTITAIYAARKLYGCSLGEAKELVNSLRENEVPRYPLESVYCTS